MFKNKDHKDDGKVDKKEKVKKDKEQKEKEKEDKKALKKGTHSKSTESESPTASPAAPFVSVSSAPESHPPSGGQTPTNPSPMQKSNSTNSSNSSSDSKTTPRGEDHATAAKTDPVIRAAPPTKPNFPPPPASPQVQPPQAAGATSSHPPATASSAHAHSPVSSAHTSDTGVTVLKTKISALPEDTRGLVEYLLNVFGRAIPPTWRPPAHFEAPALEDQVDATVHKLVEASEILFNKDHQAMLKRYGKELQESHHRRADKWKILANLIESNAEFQDAFLKSRVLDSVIRSAMLKPVEEEEVESLSDLLREALIPDVAHNELVLIVQAFSFSGQHASGNVDGDKSLSEALVDLVNCFKKQVEASAPLPSSPAIQLKPDLSDPKKAELDPSVGTNQSVALLHHASVIRHAKSGTDVSRPVAHFFAIQIEEEKKRGQDLRKTESEQKEQRNATTSEMDAAVKSEEGKLQAVQDTIKDLEAKLKQKQEEEKSLQEALAKKLAERKKFDEEKDAQSRELSEKVKSCSTNLDHHKKSEESVKKFSQDVHILLEREVRETIKKTKEILIELDKEVAFLEEKMKSYERSFSLFSAADEPEVLDGLKKLFSRSAAIYSESKQSVNRVQTVVALLRKVLTAEPDPMREEESIQAVQEIEGSLEKIVARQNHLNTTYKLQKE